MGLIFFEVVACTKLLEYPYPKTLSLSPKCLMNCLPVQEGRAERGGDRRHVAALPVALAAAAVRRVPVQRLQALLCYGRRSQFPVTSSRGAHWSNRNASGNVADFPIRAILI